MTKFFLRWIINAAALYAAIFLLDGRGVTFEGDWLSIIWLALIFGLVNAFLRPLLKLLTCPLIILTLGLFTLLINTFMFWLTGQIGQWFNLGLSV
ncbi:MAG: phage holin family protein, partial [Chloroflexota bacterium]